MRISPLVDAALSFLAENGLTAKVNKRSPHFKVAFTNQHGLRCLLILSRSPSDRRAFKQSRAELLRLLRKRPEASSPK
jgi:hypothetical protein